MPQQGLRFEDLLKAQERLLAQGDKTAGATLQRLQEMERTLKADHTISKQDRLLQIAQTYEAVKADKDDDRIADATEKTADSVEEVNNNVVKLTEAVKQAIGGSAVVSGEGAPSTGDEKVAKATQEVDTARTKGPFEDFRKLGSLKGWFDLSGPSRGVLDDIIRRRVAKTEFIETRQQVAGVTKEEAREIYKKTDEQKRIAERQKEQIDLYRTQGASEDQIQQTTAYKRLQAAREKIAEIDPLVREQVLGERVRNTFAATTGATPASFQAPLLATSEAKTNLLGGAEELQQEQQRIWQEQTDILKRIEENTRGLKDAQRPKQKTEAVPQPKAALLDLDDISMGKILSKVAGFVFSAAGLKLLVGAGLLLALKQLAEDFKEGKERSQTYQQLRQERLAGTITPERQAELDKLEAMKQTGEKPVYSGSKAEETSRALKSRIDKETAEDILKNIDSADEAERARAQETLKEFGVSKEVLQRYYDRVYGPEATAKTRAGATLGAVAVEMSQLQRTIPMQQEIAAGDAAKAATAVEVRVNEIGGEPYTPGQPLSQKQMTAISIAEQMAPGNLTRQFSAQALEQYQKQKAGLAVAAPLSPQIGDLVYAQSEANAAAATTPSAAAAPVIVNAPTSVQQTSNYGPKSPPRNTESSYQQYNRAKYSF